MPALLGAQVVAWNEGARLRVEGDHRAPLVAEVSTPRAMAPGDLSSLNVDLQNFSGGKREFAVKVEAHAPLVIADTTHRITLDDNGKKSLTFPLRAAEDYGVGKFAVNVTSVDRNGEDIRIHREFEIAVRAA